ncbi:hypothetical protein ACN27G_05920 [Plantactinospora sp. WMMB334]|uniref:hypothetical protein n=1 Tax=Plantactinospora sp. WMMB334 TaxID=3404119 RepID=UPI003B947EA9
MTAPKSRPGPAVVMAHRLVTDHADGHGCRQCQMHPRWWCPTAEWALWVCATGGGPPAGADGRRLLTVVARQVLTAHWPYGVDGCRPCGLPDCAPMQVAATWLEVIRDDYVPPSVLAQLPTRPPTDDELRRITGMD